MTNTLLALRSDLMTLPGNSIFAQSIRKGAVDDLNGVVEMIQSQSRDNYKLTEEIIGEELLKQIVEL